MKTILVAMLTLCLLCPLYAQQSAQNDQNEMVTVTVPKSSLSPQQQLTLQQDKAKTWIGIGKEFGDAVNSGLAAVTTQSNNFAQTPIGKFTVFMIAWKIVGDQMLHILGGTVLGLIFLALWLWSYWRICIPRKIYIKQTIGPDKTKVREWKIVNADDNAENWRLGHWGVGALLLIVVLTTLFSY